MNLAAVEVVTVRDHPEQNVAVDLGQRGRFGVVTELGTGAGCCGDPHGNGVSLLSSSGMPIEDISHLVGHASSRVTEKVYRKELRRVLIRGAKAMDAIFESKPDR